MCDLVAASTSSSTGSVFRALDLVDDGVAHVLDPRRVGDARDDREQRRVAAVEGAPLQRVDHLLFQVELAEERRRLREEDLRQHVEGRHVDPLVRERAGRGTPIIRNGSVGLGQVMRVERASVCGGSCGISGSKLPRSPAAVVLRRQPLELGLVEVAHHDDDAVLGPVVAVVELDAVVVVVRHVPDVLQEADRSVLVRVRRVGEIVQPLAQQRHRVREVQVVLAEDGARLGAEVVLAVLQVPEANPTRGP